MIYSNIALYLVAAQECSHIKSITQFWRDFSDRETFLNFAMNNPNIQNKASEIKAKFDSYSDENMGVICVFDDNFPCINPKTKDSEKPFLLFYKGNIDLLENLNNNVAVIGLIDPTEDIINRERVIAQKLIDNKLVIVSGLAKGCDETAHRVCVENNMPTIAILPTSIQSISPKSNRILADEIVATNGLLLSEYFKEALSRGQAVGRYIERDRLQALFSKAIIMMASYKKGEGDSGSMHAMQAAERFGINRYVVYNANTDTNDKRFGLNREFINNGVSILKSNHIEQLVNLKNDNLCQKAMTNIKQIRLI